MKLTIGGRKVSGEMITMAVFGLLVVLFLVLGLRQSASQNRQAAEFAARHGWSVSDEPGERLTRLLEQIDPEVTWRPRNIMAVDGPMSGSYFFSYQMSPKDRPSKVSRGHACVAVYGGRRFDGTVEVFNRTPGVEKLIGEREDVGSEEFRRAFTVVARDGASAQAVVNPDVQRIMLSHAASPGWYLNVTVGGGAILASSFWAESEQDWDYLITLTKRLREAAR